MKRILLLAIKDFQRRWRNPFIILGYIMIPIIFTMILGMVFGSSDEPSLPQVKVLTADNDESLVSRLFLGTFSQGELSELFQIEQVEEEQGRKLMNKNKASALIIIPKDFGEKLLDLQPVQVHIVKNPSEQFLPEIVQEVGDVATLIFSAFFAVFSDEIDLIKEYAELDSFPDQAVSQISVLVKTRIEGVSKYIFPPIVSIKQTTAPTEGEEETGGELTFHSYVLPGISIMFLLFICNIIFEDLLREKEAGTLMRMMVSPMQLNEFIWSKILTATVLGMTCTFVFIGLGELIFPVNWGHPLALVLAVLCLNILIAGFISLPYAFIRTERQAGAVIPTIIIIMSLLGGSMMPAQMFPSSIRIFSKMTLNYWGIETFYKIMQKSPAVEIIPYYSGMVILGILFSLVGAYLLKANLRKGLFR